MKDIGVKNKMEREQLFKISRFKEVIKRTKPHKHDAYFELIYLSDGAGFHWIDADKFQITPPVVFFLSGQLHYWEMTEVPKGYVMLFREGFFDKKDLVNLVRWLEDTVYVNPSEDEPYSNLEITKLLIRIIQVALCMKSSPTGRGNRLIFGVHMIMF